MLLSFLSISRGGRRTSVAVLKKGKPVERQGRKALGLQAILA
jgi:hypothetical protein